MEGYNCIGCSPDNPFGLHLCFYEDGDDIVTTWKPSPLYQGWLNTLHGGIQALLLDEVCGWVVTRKLQTAGCYPIQLKRRCVYRSHLHLFCVTTREGRKRNALCGLQNRRRRVSGYQ